ncbi:uncharacterized protein BDCG_17117 [Blastomyces dermatitidis ER-3]|uniref:Uncharacterized protein n=1 Tax=Ajellomyces dermatitidis (strain ER-3 / ATCC MYA-2586) TaxID=559297 RepID=A0ABX2VWH1_AJEDR|nr:uncharacterized protein BDCG_17117 [Blastomyces dermatitidis ER-3]OAT01509.1 hypothetical protein BDCG_17117 [Blastomyces dermatitidis ER-3]
MQGTVVPALSSSLLVLTLPISVCSGLIIRRSIVVSVAGATYCTYRTAQEKRSLTEDVKYGVYEYPIMCCGVLIIQDKCIFFGGIQVQFNSDHGKQSKVSVVEF